MNKRAGCALVGSVLLIGCANGDEFPTFDMSATNGDAVDEDYSEPYDEWAPSSAIKGSFAGSIAQLHGFDFPEAYVDAWRDSGGAYMHLDGRAEGFGAMVVIDVMGGGLELFQPGVRLDLPHDRVSVVGCSGPNTTDDEVYGEHIECVDVIEEPGAVTYVFDIGFRWVSMLHQNVAASITVAR